MKTTLQIVTDMVNVLPETARRNLDALKHRYGDWEVDAKHSSYHFWRNNKSLADAAGPLYTKLKTLRKVSRELRDKLVKPIGERYTQKNIDALQKAFRTIDAPHRCDANSWRFEVSVQGFEHTQSKGSWHGPIANIKLPLTYFKNVQQVKWNEMHRLTRDGEQFICFITRYNPIPDDSLPEAKVFKTRNQNVSPTGGGIGENEGWYIEQQFDDRVVNAFNWDYKKAKQLFNKRVKAKMMELLAL